MIGLLLFFTILVIIFSIPGVQTFMAGKVANSINKANDVNINIGKIKLSYNGDVDINDVLIQDHHKDTLIFASEINTSILSLSRLMDVKPLLGSTTIRGLQLDIRIYKGEERDNLSIFTDKFKNDSPRKPAPFQLSADEVEIINSEFSYIDANAKVPEVIVVDELNFLGENLKIDDADVFVDILNMSGLEQRGIDIALLSTDFSYTKTAMDLKDLELRTSESVVKGDLHFDLENGFGNFVNNVPIVASFEESSVSSNDLEIFYSGFGADQQLNFSTVLEGTLNDFELNDFRFEGMDRTTLNADLIVQNLFPKENEIFSIQGDVDELATNYYDLVNLLPEELDGKLPTEIQEFGNVQMEGYVVVTANSVDANLVAHSQLGSADIAMMIGNFNDSELATYQGNLKVTDFNIGELLEEKNLGKTSFNLNFDGRGFTAESLDTDVRGDVLKFGYNGYIYNDIKVRGTLKAPVFNGNLVSFDPNLEMEFNGLIDFSEETNIYDFQASVDYADLEALNFVSRDELSVFKGDVFVNMRGTNLNNIAGEVLLLNTSYENLETRFVFDDLRITSNFDGPVRTIEVVSPDVINGTVQGVFDITEVPALFENALGSLYTNYRPNELTTNQYLEFNFDIYNKIVEVFLPNITLAPNTFIRGRVESDESEFRLTFSSPQINAFDNVLEQVNLQVDNTNPLFNTYVEIDSVGTDIYDFSNFNLINVTLNDTLFIRSEFRGGPENDDIFNLNLYHTINEDNNSVLGLQQSDIKFKESVWHLNEHNNSSNRVIFEDGFEDIRIDSLVLSHQNEEIRLSGQMRDSTYKNFKVIFDQVDLGKITPEIDSLAMGGIVNGNLNLLQREGAYYPSTSLTIANLEINDHLMGNLNVDIMGNKDLSLYNINTSLERNGVESLSAIGAIVVDKEVPTINLDVSLNNLNLGAFSPLGRNTISDIRGFASGNADVSGSYKNPDINGKLTLADAGLSIPYLNVDFDFEDQAVVNLDQQQFHFDNITLTDTKYGTTGILDGTISHQNFKEWRLALDLSSDRIIVLDTEANEDALYYGTAFISGNAAIHGPTDELIIDVVATTESGTVFKIPIDDSESMGDNSYIHFLSPVEKAALLAGEEIELQEVKGLELNFDLDVTSDALVEIEIDGSILRGKGAGTLLIEINTLGKFNMWGDFIANTGEYIFNYGALQKRFEVRPGGSINWNGNPVSADLNISAVYEAHANPAIILENSGISRRIPVNVVINLQGELVQPEISFDLEFPNAASAVRSELEYKIETTANTEMQAFSLISLGQFYSQNVLAANSGTAMAFESASGFFNNLLSDESGKFQVGLNYEQGIRTPEQTTADRFGVTLTTQISERVLINGQVGVPVGGVTETVVIGNLEIEFLLNEEGNLRAKIFNRESNIQYIGEELGFTQGVGITYQVDFDTFRELIKKILNAEMKAVREELEQEESVESLAPDYIDFPGANGGV